MLFYFIRFTNLFGGSIAVNIFLGILSLYLVYLVVRAAQMELLASILGQFMGVGVLAMIILFQPEIRKFLLVIGRSAEINRDNIFKTFQNWRHGFHDDFDVHQLIEAVKAMKATRTGALIVFSRDMELKFYCETGDPLDAEVNKRLLISIFNKLSPLHDGAVIIYKGRIQAARCVLPVSEKRSFATALWVASPVSYWHERNHRYFNHGYFGREWQADFGTQW